MGDATCGERTVALLQEALEVFLRTKGPHDAATQRVQRLLSAHSRQQQDDELHEEEEEEDADLLRQVHAQRLALLRLSRNRPVPEALLEAAAGGKVRRWTA